jgi:hypothetical protein
MLKRLVTATDLNGNLGRQFVKCESKPERWKVRFEFFWLQFRVFVQNVGFDLGFEIRFGILYLSLNWVLCSLPYQILPKCWHFEWHDEYIEMIQPDVAPIQELDLPQPVEPQGRAASDGIHGRNVLLLCNFSRICLSHDN